MALDLCGGEVGARGGHNKGQVEVLFHLQNGAHEDQGNVPASYPNHGHNLFYQMVDDLFPVEGAACLENVHLDTYLHQLDGPKGVGYVYDEGHHRMGFATLILDHVALSLQHRRLCESGIVLQTILYNKKRYLLHPSFWLNMLNFLLMQKKCY